MKRTKMIARAKRLPEPKEWDDRAFVRDLVAQYTTGNASMNMGNYLSVADYEKEKQEYLNIKFNK